MEQKIPKFTKEFLQEVKARNNIIELASEYYQLEQFGNIYRAKCKHGEDSPSLIFYPDTQSFYCYGCHAGDKTVTGGSDIISFVQWMEDLSWQQAVIFLCTRAKIPIPKYSLSSEEESNMKLYQSASNLSKAYTDALKNDKATREWFLETKHLTQEDIAIWKLGSHNGKPAYSISDEYGRVVGFSYRNGTDPKYINNESNPIFKKGNILYGLDVCSRQIRLKKYVVVVEGYNDAILLNKFGVPAVAIMSTTISSNQLALLKRHTNQIILWLDGDEPGRVATESNIIKLINAKFQVDVININATDPDEIAYIEKENLEKYILNIRRNAVYYLLNSIIANYQNSIMSLASETLLECEQIISKIEDEKIRSLLNQILSKSIMIGEKEPCMIQR